MTYNPTNDNTLGGIKAWMVWACAALFYCYQYIIRVSPNVMTEDLMQAFSIDATALGVIVAFYYYAYAGMQLPMGALMDRFGPGLILSFASFVCAAACFIFSATNDATSASLARFMMGLGSACGWLGILKLGTLWFRPQQLGKVIGFTMTLGTVGAATGGLPLEFLIDCVGWRKSMVIIGVVGMAIGALIFITARNTPPTLPEKSFSDAGNETIGFLEGIKCVIFSRQVWMLGIYAMLMYVPLTILGDLWGVPFIQKFYLIDEKFAAPVVSFLFVGIACGSPVFAMLSDRFESRKIPLFLGALATLLIYCAIFFIPGIPLTLMYALFFLAGFFFPAQCLCFAAVCEITPLNASGLVIGFINMVVMLSGVLFHPLVGKLLDLNSNHLLSDGIPMYELADFRIALSIIPLCLGGAFILSFFIHETYPKTQASTN
jgi:sugar phosphate permease